MIFPSLKDNVILKPKRKEVITMPGTKGSKNCLKINTTNDYASQIAEKQTALKKAEKEVATLEAKKAKADAKAAEEAKKTEAEDVLKKLLASGMSVDEILEKLK